jgi:PAS domain S-box-containing protein
MAMGGAGMASAPTYAREIRQSAARLAVVALVTAAAVCLLAWHQTHDRHVREDAVLRHYAALAAIATLEEAAQDLRSGGPPGPTGLRVARAVDRLQAAEAGTADGVSRDLMARLEAGWRDVKAGGDPDVMAAAIEALEAHHAAATESLEASDPFRDGPAPWSLVLPMAALVGVGGFAAHRLVRRIARAADGQRAVEDALRADEAGHARAQAIAGLGHWSWDLATDRVVRSAETYRILGHTPETLDATGADFFQAVHADDRDHVRSTARAAMARRGPLDLEFRVVRPDGTVRHIHSRAETSVDAATGEATGLVGTVLDITDRKLAEEALVASERRFRQIFDGAPFGIALGDTRGNVIEVNAAFARFTGYRPEELRGRRFADLCHPDDLGSYHELVEKAHGGATGTIERRYLRKDGATVWGRLTLGPVGDGEGPHEFAIGIVEDITCRRAMEEALQERDELLRQVMDTIEEIFWLKDGDATRFLYVSPAFETIYGRSLGSVHDDLNTWLDAVHPDDRARVSADVEGALKTGSPYAGSYRILRPDGTERIIQGRGYPVRDADGKVCRWAGISADVTELHRLQSALEESEDRLRQVAEFTGEVFWMNDTDMRRMHYVSPSYERVFGVSVQSVYDDATNWIQAIVPEQRDDLRREVTRARAEGLPYEVRYRIVRPDGSERSIRTRGYPMPDEDGVVRRWAGVAADITELHRLETALQEHEERLREVTEHIGEVFWVSEVEGGRVTYVSPAYEAVWGRPVETVYSDPRGWFDAIHPDDRPAVVRTMETALAAGEAYENAYRIVRPDGTERHIRDRGHPVRDADGKVRRYVGVAADVTEQREAEEDRRRYQEELAHVTRLATMGQMASELAHEINQPLAAIANYAQGSIRRLKAGVGPGENGLLESLERIAGQADRAGDIVRHLRDLVAKGPGRRTVEDVNALVAAALRLTEPEARRRGVRLRLDAGVDLEPVEVDRIQLDQVLINLTNNAIEALAARPGAREVVVATRGDGDGHVRVSVTDNGPGLPPDGAEARERLFGPFFTTKAHGLGMGLAISRTIVEAHGGTLTAEPGPAGGAVFQFTVPVAGEGIDG